MWFCWEKKVQKTVLSLNYRPFGWLTHLIWCDALCNVFLQLSWLDYWLQSQPGTLTINSPNSLQPGTVYLIRSPNGELQLVRLAGAPNTAQQGPGNAQPRPGLPQANSQMPQNLRFPTVKN